MQMLHTVCHMQTDAVSELAGLLLRTPLSEWVRERRESTPKQSWESISRQLFMATKQRVSLSGETLRRRYGQDIDSSSEPTKAAS